MKKFWIQFVALVLIIFASLYLTYDNSNLIGNILPNHSPGVTGTTGHQATIGTTQIKIEIADNAQARAKGLGGRTSLDPNSGMLFVFTETKKYQFWMKGMQIPIDFIFITNGRVVDILTNIPAPVPGTSDENLAIYEPVLPINQLLEVNAGFVEAHHIQVGDLVQVN